MKLVRFASRYLSKNNSRRLPEHVRKLIKKNSDDFKEIRSLLKDLNLSTVCQEAKCPNMGECWGEYKTATIMIMGDACTRSCGFCSVQTEKCPDPLDVNEPENIAKAVELMELDYVVLTTVSRDDVEDYGCAHMMKTVNKIKEGKEEPPLVELLVNDFQGNWDLVSELANCGIEVYAHNLETVERLQSNVRDPRTGYRQSLDVLKHAKRANREVLTKTSLMLGLGENDEDIMNALYDLRDIGCDVVTFGQYLQPTKKNLEVVEYVDPEKFDFWAEQADKLGFLYCASGPLVRSSYKAAEYYIKNILQGRKKGKNSCGGNEE